MSNDLGESHALRRDDLNRAIIASATDYAIISISPEGLVTSWSEGARRVLGWEESEMRGRPANVFFTEEDCAAGVPQAEMAKARAVGRANDDRWLRRKDGTLFWANGRMMALRAEDGVFLGFLKIVTDRSEQRKIEEALKTSDERLQFAMEAAGAIGAWDWDIANGLIYATARFAELYSLDPEKVAAGAPASGFTAAVHPDDQERVTAVITAAVRDGGAVTEEYRLLQADGSIVWVLVRGRCYHDDQGRPLRFPGVAIDITQRRRTEEALRQSDASRELALRIADLGCWDHDWTAGVRVYDARARKIMGFPPEGEIGPDAALAAIHPDDRDRISAAVLRAADQVRRGPYAEEFRVRKGESGAERWVAVSGQTFFERDRCVRFTGVIADITDRKQAEAELRASREALRAANETLEQRIDERTRELQLAEEALRQSQKMEAIGQLTGGIAHDFNNLLTGILGSLDLMRRRIKEGRSSEIDRFMDAASASAHRAAALTHRLLAFARRQPLAPSPVEIETLVTSMEELLNRTLGEGVGLAVLVDPDLWLVMTDQNQLESALLNLAINARDAMPEGGRLTIEAANVSMGDTEAFIHERLEPGDYVMICVTDTGVGMTPDVRAKAFEPFFTTKPIGQGTGLGLSMIYGFAKQSGGHVRLYSEVGHGTTVKLYLPRHQGGKARAGDPIPARAAPRGAGETVLVVEDDAAVRMLIAETLDEIGYAAVKAPDAEAAIAILSSPIRIDLLISDVGLPGMSGRRLADIARQRRPGLGVLFVTGYAEKAAARDGFLDPGMDMLTKPFAMEALATKIRRMIEGG